MLMDDVVTKIVSGSGIFHGSMMLGPPRRHSDLSRKKYDGQSYSGPDDNFFFDQLDDRLDDRDYYST